MLVAFNIPYYLLLLLSAFANAQDRPNLYTLTAYKPGDAVYNGLKAEYSGDLQLFIERTSNYCASVATNCPNGTDTAFAGTLFPLSEVPGGQELYVTSDGEILITVQHSHTFPPGSYPNYYGWTWTAVPEDTEETSYCPGDSPQYNCDPPSGYFNFQAPNATVGGIKACKNRRNNNVTSVYAVTPQFNLTGCVDLMGLGTHNYTGPNPPVWAY